MEIWKAAVLDAVQGICEFLPVSSSGHLLLFERILGTDTEGADLFLGVMLHAGTLLSALLVFAPRIVQILRADRRRALLVLLATVPAALAGVFLGDAVDAVFFGGEWLWAAFLATSLLLLAASHRMRRGGLLRPLNAKNSLAVGAAQALAVIPGLSRSGTTFAAGVLCGLSREDAAEFSFLLGIPVVAGAVLSECLKAAAGAVSVSAVSWQSLAVGALCAALTGWFALRFTLRAAVSGRIRGFAAYLAALSALLLIFRFIPF